MGASLQALSPTDLWAAEVAGRANLPDERLNDRFAQVLATLAAKPLDSIPQAFGSAGQAKATYRFISNKRIGAGNLLQAFAAATVEQCRGQPVVLSIQDTTTLNYSSLDQTTGLGPLHQNKHSQGLHLHTTLAVSTDGVPLGLLHQSCWSRAPGKVSDHRLRPIEAKESRKWLDGVQGADAATAALPESERPRLIHIMDREGDIYDVFEQITAAGQGAIIRCRQDRRVTGPIGLAYQALAAEPLLGVITSEIPPRPGQRKRPARLELRCVTAQLRPHRPTKRPDCSVTWTLLEAREVETPPGIEPLHWLLWTNEPVRELVDAIEVLRFYKIRWRIEDFHLTLKSGCRTEALELETALRLTKAITLYSAVAVHILALRDLARQRPDTPCTTILSTDAWKALWGCIHKKPVPADTPVPTVKQAVLWIGRLGGHLGRKRDGMPGVRTLWRGWRDLVLLVTGYRIAKHLS